MTRRSGRDGSADPGGRREGAAPGGGQAAARTSSAPGEDRTDAERLLIRVVHDLALEIEPRKAGRLDVTLTSDLDRDLGIDSLGRAELLHRLDRAFGIRLPETLISEASTVGDLLGSILTAKPAGRLPDAARMPLVASLPEAEEPLRAGTLLDILASHVEREGSRPHIHLWISDEEERQLTYADLDRWARKVAAGLAALGIEPGERVAIMLPTCMEFFPAFFGVIMAGGVPVPVYPPFRRYQVEDHLRRQAGILRNAQARILITDAEIRPLAALLYGLVEDLRKIVTVPLLAASQGGFQPKQVFPETIALIQYTSGSTGDPKGVVLTHANLLANIRAMGQALEASSHDVFVSWLPLYHDMGLIGAWLGSLYYGVPVAIMSPLAFLANPTRWLWAIHRHRATLSAAPNFAYELCLKSVRDADIEGLDLKSLRMVVNGAEPVSPATIASFTDRFGRFGFRREAMAPVYGLAECAVGLAFPPVGRAPLIDRVERAPLSVDGRAVPAKADDASALEFVACGQPLPHHEIRIVDELGLELPDRRQGRLQFKGPSATSGYFRNEEKTRRLFDGVWLDSGDLAYIAQGDIYVTGRIKDIIIRAGRHIFPQELEEAVGAVEGVRKGCVVAFASRDRRAGTEQLVVMAETRLTDERRREDLRRAIRETCLAAIEMPPDEVVLVPPRTVPKTSSGKLRRSAARELFERGGLVEKARSLWLQLLRLVLEGAVRRARRAAGNVADVAYAGWWWSLLVLLGIVVWPSVVLLPDRRWRHGLLHRASRLFLWLTGTPLAVEGRSDLPEGGAILVANHASYLDGLVLSAAIDGELTFVAKYGFQHEPIRGPFLVRLGTLFVHRVDAKEGLEDTETMVRSVQGGARLVIMPEGTFARTPGLLPFRLGAFQVAASAGLPVVPVIIKGTRMALRPDQWFPRWSPISILIGEPIRPQGRDFAAAIQLRDRSRAVMLAHSGEPDLSHKRVELPPD